MEIEVERMYLAALQSVPGIGSAKLRRLAAHFGSARGAWEASQEELAASGALDAPALAALAALRRRPPDFEKLARSWEARGIRLLAWYDAAYPSKLKEIFKPPALLYCRGRLAADGKRIAVVGARQATAYGKSAAQAIARALAESGVEIVSGAARGIDAAAHQGALDARGSTVAVLGCGVDVAYPAENKRLLDEIAECGAVVSEYAPGTRPNAKFFPARNRIISGLSDGIVVAEAALKSGALITAEFALSEGRDVFAVPGSVFSPASQGCHRLIQQGAKLTSCAADILEEYAWDGAPDGGAPQEAALSAEEKRIYDVLDVETPRALDEIIVKARADASQIGVILLQLELRGLVRQCSPQRYVRSVKEGL